MYDFRLSPQAEKDIEAILNWSHDQFGERVRLRYEGLLSRAILDVAERPNRPGSQKRPEVADGAWTYHLRHSRDHVSRAIGRIRNPRHFLLYRLADDGRLEIGRVLHDGMDIARHLPPGYRSDD